MGFLVIVKRAEWNGGSLFVVAEVSILRPPELSLIIQHEDTQLTDVVGGYFHLALLAERCGWIKEEVRNAKEEVSTLFVHDLTFHFGFGPMDRRAMGVSVRTAISQGNVVKIITDLTIQEIGELACFIQNATTGFGAIKQPAERRFAIFRSVLGSILLDTVVRCESHGLPGLLGIITPKNNGLPVGAKVLALPTKTPTEPMAEGQEFVLYLYRGRKADLRTMPRLGRFVLECTGNLERFIDDVQAV